MIALLQRVSQAEIRIADQVIAAIGSGLVVFAAVERDDTVAQSARLWERILGFRVFADERGRMNLSVAEVGGAVLLIPQFTLAADTAKGTRASFTGTAEPTKGRQLFDELIRHARNSGVPVQSGQFGADMQVTLTNEGPVTFWLEASCDGA